MSACIEAPGATAMRRAARLRQLREKADAAIARGDIKTALLYQRQGDELLFETTAEDRALEPEEAAE